MQLLVNVLGHRTVIVTAEVDATVSSLKEQLQLVTQLPSEEIRLKSGPHYSLSDGATLGDYQLQHGSTVDLLLRLRGGGRKVAYFYDSESNSLHFLLFFFFSLHLRSFTSKTLDYFFLMFAFIAQGDMGHFYYGPGHPMKPHRIKLAHHLILSYGLYRKMEVYRPHRAVVKFLFIYMNIYFKIVLSF
jgi:hypothetical protein